MESYKTAGGAVIYQITLQEFPGLVGNVYLVLLDDYRVLIDTGSGFGESNNELEKGLNEVSSLSEVDCTLPNLTHILITHGHIDHFGGLTHVRPRTNAKIGIHELDRRIVTNHAERLLVVAHRLDEFLTEAGVSPEQRLNLLEMYKITKSVFRSVNIDMTYEEIGMRLGPFEFMHVPGHCAGHVVIRLHDFLFSGDHVLEKTSPHQAPEQITLSTGLEHYLKSLDAVRPLSKEVSLTLGGHENPIRNLEARVAEIRDVHRDRLQKVLDLLVEPHTVAEISRSLFGEVQGYTILLALEEAGAHVEYLYQAGLLEIANLRELEENSDLVPIRYQCIECKINKI